MFRKMITGVSTVMLGLALALPMSVPVSAQEQDAVQFRRHWDGGGRDWNGRRHWNNDRRGWHNGHRGYRHRRDGYRYHDGWWFPPAAFALGAIVGGAIANQPPPRRVIRGGNAHVEWCYDRYRSYRASDNTFQPYNGPRRQCYSPYS